MEARTYLKLDAHALSTFRGSVTMRMQVDMTKTPRFYQQRGLGRLLGYVWKRSAFYRDYYSSHGISEKDLPDISIRDLPFLSKEILMENFDLAVTDPRLRKADIEQWLQDEPE